MLSRLAVLSVFALLACPSAIASAPVVKNEATALASAEEMRFTPAQQQADLQSLHAFVAQTHPEPAHSASVEVLKAAWARMAGKLNTAMSRQELWRELSTINPLLNDAHWVIDLPYEKQPLARVLQEGGALFPLELHVNAQGEIQVLTETGGAVSEWQGAQLLRINGVPAREVAEQLLARMHGDTPAFRANLLSARWATMYWKLYGSPAQYTLELAHNGKTERVQLAASRKLPRAAAQAEQFDSQFRFEKLPSNAAVLTLGTFYWPDGKAISAFTEKAFRELKASKIDTLIIDVRKNRGGNDDVWLDNVLPYLADKPYRTGSTWRKKVIPGRASGTEKVGDVVEGEISTWRQPPLDQPLRFHGRVFVLIGRETYSSAVLFSNVMQDFGFATLVGEAGYVRSRSSGGIQVHTLPHSGLEVVVPRFILARPAGDTAEALLRPDWQMPDDPLNERTLIDAVLERIRAEALASKI